MDLPLHASVVVIGGGVMGCSTLYHLAKAGISDAILLERNQLTSGTTWHSAAQVRALRSSQGMTNLIKYSISLYAELEKETGQNTGWINKGSLSIATNQDRLTHIKRQKALADGFGIQANTISASEALERWPLMNIDDVIGAVWSPQDGRVSPSDLCAALTKGARTKGAKLFENTPVTGFVIDGGRIKAVITPGRIIACNAVALCTGLWSRKVAGQTGLKVPIWPCEHYYLLTRGIDGLSGNLPTLSDHDAHLYIRDDSGGLLIGCFEPNARASNPDDLGEKFAFQLLPENWEHFEPMMRNAIHRLPVLETAQVKMLLNGPESFTPDSTFLLGESGLTKGFFLGCGMNSFGVASGGGAGMALAEFITKGCAPFELYETDPNRFPECYSSIENLAVRIPEVLGKHYEISYPDRQYKKARNLKLLPLHDNWKTAGATFGQTFGWERPLYFGHLSQANLTFGKPSWHEQVKSEVHEAHYGVAMFEQSALGKILVQGTDSENFLDRICANNLRRPVGDLIYTAMLNEKGGFEQDLVIQRLSETDFRLFVGSSEPNRTLHWLSKCIQKGERVTFSDVTSDYTLIGVMGAKSTQLANKLKVDELNDIGFFKHRIVNIKGISCHAARLSYVGEPGWEIAIKKVDSLKFFDILQSAGVTLAGAHAQTSMRIEKRFLAMGQDIDGNITPLEAGLEFAVNWNKFFNGREALLSLKNKGVKRFVASVVFDDVDVTPIGGEPIYYDSQPIGQITSASFGYRCGRPVGIGWLRITPPKSSQKIFVEVDIAGQKVEAYVSLKPAFEK